MTAQSGQIILSTAFLSTAVTVPLGVIGIKLTMPRQLTQDLGRKENIP